MNAKRILMTEFRKNAKKYVEDMYRGESFYIGKSQKAIGCTDLKSVQKDEVKSVQKDTPKKEGFKKVIKCEQKKASDSDENYLKLSGEMPLGLNEYIDENTGDLIKHNCAFCNTDKILIKMNTDGNNICMNCSPSIPSFESYKSLTEYYSLVKTEKKVEKKNAMHKHTEFGNSVNAVPKPVKKKKKK